MSPDDSGKTAVPLKDKKRIQGAEESGIQPLGPLDAAPEREPLL